MMETVHCHGNAQRFGEGGSPERVQTIEDHSGVSVLKREIQRNLYRQILYTAQQIAQNKN